MQNVLFNFITHNELSNKYLFFKQYKCKKAAHKGLPFDILLPELVDVNNIPYKRPLIGREITGKLKCESRLGGTTKHYYCG